MKNIFAFPYKEDTEQKNPDALQVMEYAFNCVSMDS